MDKKKTQEKYMEIQMLEQQFQEMQEYLVNIENKLVRSQQVKGSLTEFENIKEGQEILVPVGDGIFAKAKLLNNKELKLNTGSNTVVTKKIGEIKKLIDEQPDEISSVYKKITQDIQKIISKISETEQELKKLS